MTSRARLQLLGVPTLVHEGRSWVLPCERRSQLLVLLALRGAWVGRGEVATMLWHEQDSRLASTNLRKTLFRLAALPWGRLVDIEANALRFDGETDVAAFESALREQRLADALALHQGELASGFDDDANEAWSDWLGHHRERVRTAWRGAALAWLDGDAPAAAALALSARLLEADPFDEAALRLHLGWLLRSGQPGEAQRVHRRFVKRLADELGVTPSPAMEALGASLDDGAPPAAAGAEAPAGAPARRRVGAAAATAPVAGIVDPGFVGRGAELRRIASLLAQEDCRLLSLLGPGGVGKTRLARRALQELAPGFADGAAFVSLEDVADAATFGEALARALGLRSDGRGDALGDAAKALAPRQMLLVLDNAEGLVAHAGCLPLLLQQAAKLKLLVTSRVRLALAEEWVLPVEGLPCPDAEDSERIDAFDAARLFVRSAQRLRPDFTPGAEAAAIADICRQVEGLPLALELAAAWVRLLPCADIAAELRRGTELLQARGPAAPPRHAGIEQVFEQSWQRLHAPEQQALARLAVFRGGFTTAAAHAVAGASMPVLGSLLDKSLLHRDGQRLRLHPLVQQLALARLPDDLREATAGAHSRHFLQWLARLRRAAEAGERDALMQMDAEVENARAAWQHAAAVERPAGQMRSLADAALALMSHADHRGLRQPGLAFGHQAAASAAACAQTSLRAVLLAACAHLEHRLDHDAEAEGLAAQAIALAREQDVDARALALKVLGMATMRLGRLDDARRHHAEGLRLADQAGDPGLTATLLGNLALVERRCGRHDEATALLERAVHEHKRLGDVARATRCLNNLGAHLCDLRQFAAAQRHVGEALALCEQHGLHGTLGMVLGNLCYIALENGDFAAATAHGRRALEQLAQVGDRAAACSVHQSLAMTALRQRRPAEASAELVASMRIAQSLAHPALQLLGLVVFAQWLAAAGEVDTAHGVLGIVTGHPAAAAHVQQQAAHTLAGLPPPAGPVPAWPASKLTEVVQGMVGGGASSLGELATRLRPTPQRAR